jgi:hypothetical protein
MILKRPCQCSSQRITKDDGDFVHYLHDPQNARYARPRSPTAETRGRRYGGDGQVWALTRMVLPGLARPGLMRAVGSVM